MLQFRLAIIILLLLGVRTAQAETELIQAVTKSEWMLLDDPAAALRFAEELLPQVNPEDVDLWLRLATVTVAAYSYLERPSEGLDLIKEMEARLSLARSPQWQILALVQKAATLSFQQNAAEAIQAAEEAIRISEFSSLPLYEARARSQLALLEARRNHKTAAVEQLVQAMRLLRGTEKNYIHLVTLNFIANSFLVLDGIHVSKALDVLKEMKEQAEHQKLRFYNHLTSYNMGDVYVMLQKEAEAIQSFQEASYYAEVIRDDLSQAYALLGLADVYRYRSQSAEAKKALKKAMGIFKDHGNISKAFECHNYLLELALHDRNYAEARIHLNAIDGMQLDPDQMGAFLELESHKSAYYEAIGEPAKALAALKSYLKIKLKESSQKEQEAAQKYAAQFELERKEQENLLLAQKNEIQQLTIDQNERRATIKSIIIGSASLLLLILSIGMIRIRYQNHVIRRLNQHIKTDVLQRFLPPQLVDDILAGRSSLNNVPHHQTVTVLFSDLCEFTRMTDVLDADTIATLLNEFFVGMTEVIFSEDGTIDKFIGDAIMVLFGAPNIMTAEEQAQKAARCAVKMQARLDALNESWSERYGKRLAMRIGLHQGPAVVGSFGGRRRSDYTAVGRAVNLASRVESIAEPGTIYLTEAVARYLEPQHLIMIGMKQLRGLAEPAMILKIDAPGKEALKNLKDIA
jgi:class 3 adenylate cyclase/tetratricopeptide (TPR) repeat protein